MKKVNIIMRAIPQDKWNSKKYTKSDIVICDCGYIELKDDQDLSNTDIWNLCNWSCWSKTVPPECRNLLIDHCNSDMAFEYEGKWYSHMNTLEGTLESCINHMRSEIYGDEYSSLWPVPKSARIMNF